MNDRSSLAPTLRSAFVDFHHSQPLLYLQPRRPLLPELVLQLIQPASQHRGGRSFVGRGCGSTLSRNSRRPGGPPGGSDGPHALTFALVVVIVVGVLVAVGSSKRPVLPELSPECFLLDDLLDLEDGSGGVSGQSGEARSFVGVSPRPTRANPAPGTGYTPSRPVDPDSTHATLVKSTVSVPLLSSFFHCFQFFGQPANKKRPDILSNRANHGLQESRPSTLALFSPRVST